MDNHLMYVETPVGRLQLKEGTASRGVPHLKTLKWKGVARGQASTDPLLKKASQELKEYFKGQRKKFSAVVQVDNLEGTDFQRQVWKQIAAIPFGQTRTYSEIAKAVGRPKAFRAVGTATGKNPVPIFIPCHRVLAADQKLGGFNGGLKRKKILLDLEGIEYQG